MLYGGQRWNSNNPKGKGDRAAVKEPVLFDPLSLMGWLNCDKTDHVAKACPAPYNGSTLAAWLQEYQEKRNAKRAAVSQVL